MPDAILFVDDEEFFAHRYIASLQGAGHVVHYCTRAEEVVPCLKAHQDIRGIVLDIMIPTPPGVLAERTRDGLNTGLWLLRQIRTYVESEPRPVFVLTNRNVNEVRAGLNELEFAHGLITVRRKIDVRATDFPGELASFFEEARRRFRGGS